MYKCCVLSFTVKKFVLAWFSPDFSSILIEKTGAASCQVPSWGSRVQKMAEDCWWARQSDSKTGDRELGLTGKKHACLSSCLIQNIWFICTFWNDNTTNYRICLRLATNFKIAKPDLAKQHIFICLWTGYTTVYFGFYEHVLIINLCLYYRNRLLLNCKSAECKLCSAKRQRPTCVITAPPASTWIKHSGDLNYFEQLFLSWKSLTQPFSC